MVSRVVLRNELYMARRTLAASTIGIAVLMAVFAGLSGFVIESSTGDLLMQLMANLPPALLQAFNFDIDSLQSFEGWMASEPYTFFVLILGMMAATAAMAVVAREIDQGTAESVVALPIRRRTLFLSKAASHVIIATVAAAAGVVAALLAGYLTVGIDDPAKIVALLSAGWFTSLAFSGIGYAVSPLVDEERTATSLGAGLVLGSFVVDILSTFSDKLAWIARVSLFSLFDVNAVVATGSVPLLPCLIALLLFGGGIGLGTLLFERKDIFV